MPIYNLNTTENSGGYARLEIYKISDVADCPSTITPYNVLGITFNQPTEPIDVFPVGDSIFVKEPPRERPAGVEYSISAGFTAKYQNPALHQEFEQLFNIPVMFVAVKRDGSKKVYGSTLYPLRFSYEPLNGKKLEDDHGFKITVKGKTPQRPIQM